MATSGVWNDGVWNGPGPAPTPGVPATIFLQDLLRSSFRCIGQLRPGFGYSPSELIDALFILNSMLDSWATDDLNAFCTLIQSFPLVPGTGVYTVGPGGMFNGSRPTRIDKATLVVMTNPSQPLRINLSLKNAAQWESIHLQLTLSTLTRALFYNPTFPFGTANFWPVPTEADFVEFNSGQMLSEGFIASTDQFIAPPGYRDAVRYQLAIRLAMEWDKPLKDGVIVLATEALAKIQRLNAPTPQMQVNPGVMPVRSGSGSWNWLTGEEE